MGFPLKIISPPVVKSGRPWIWKTEFLDAFTIADEELLRSGFYLVHLEVCDHFGCPKAVGYGCKLYDFLTDSFAFSSRVCLLGLSRGGLWAYNWAVANSEKVALIYGDNPVCDFKSWPGGMGCGPGDGVSWRRCLEAYELTEGEAKRWIRNPVDRLEVLARRRVPILHVIGDSDEIVPVEENSDLVRDRYRTYGGLFEEMIKPGGKHHPHGLPDNPAPIIEFFMRYAPLN